MRTQGGEGSIKFRGATRAGIPIWSSEDFLARLPDTLPACLALAGERAEEAIRARRALVPVARAPESAADIKGEVVVITGGVSGSGGDQGALKALVRKHGGTPAEQAAEGVTYVVVRGTYPSDEKLDDAEWWGIPVVEAAAFWAMMLQDDGDSVAPPAPKRLRSESIEY